MVIKMPTNIRNTNSNNQIRFRSLTSPLKIKSVIKQINTKNTTEIRLGYW